MNFAEMPFPAFCRAVGVTLYPWQAEAFGQACARKDGRFRYRLAGISVPRGNGKSLAAAAVGLWRLVCGGKRQDIISAALDLEGAQVVLDHARTIVQACPALDEMIEIRANQLLVKKTRSRWSITSREHTSSRGRHPTVVIHDETGWSRDSEAFASLQAGQASVEDPFTLVVSTVGRRQSGPLATIKQLHEGGDPSVYWYHTPDNLSPMVTAEFLEQQRRILMPAAFAREHQNSWVDAADSFTSSDEVDDAMSTGAVEQHVGRDDVDAHVFVDFGTVHDPTVIGLGYADDGRIVIARLVTFQGTKAKPVQIAAVEHALRGLCAEWRVRRIRVESWQGVGTVQSLKRLDLPIELFTPTPKAHAEEWPQLAARLSSRTLDLFPHARLREELLNLVYEVGPTGVRVVDRGSVHQDHAVAVRGIVAQIGQRRERVVPCLDGAFQSGPTNDAREDALAAGDYEPNSAVPDPGGVLSDYQRGEKRRGAFNAGEGTRGAVRFARDAPPQPDEKPKPAPRSRSGRTIPDSW